MIKFFRQYICSLICLSLLLTTPALWAATSWQKLADGIDYTSINANNTAGKVLAFRVDLKHYKLVLVSAKDKGTSSANVASLALQTGGVIAINGGFFDPMHNALGLRIQNGQLLNPIRPISWWGIFSIMKNTHAAITSQQGFTLGPNIDFAIQSGPRLVIDGRIPPLKESYAARSALGIDAQGRVLIAITTNVALTPAAFANILQRSKAQDGLGCNNALNLDGGSSSQLYAHVGDFQTLIPSFNNIADAVVVVPR